MRFCPSSSSYDWIATTMTTATWVGGVEGVAIATTKGILEVVSSMLVSIFFVDVASSYLGSWSFSSLDELL